MGTGRRCQPAVLLGTENSACDRCGTDRSLSAALIATQHGPDVHVIDIADSGPRPKLVRALGATYHTGTIADLGFEPDVIIECTGVGTVVKDSIGAVASGGVIRLTGVGSGGVIGQLHIADVAAHVVLRNNVVVGSVNR